MNPAVACPSCRQPMARQRFARQLHGEVELDLCFTCQGIWFDEFESLQIAPGGIIELFRLIHEHRDDLRQPLADPLRCPRCDDRLLHGLDVSKRGGRFNYHRCLQKHGRFTTFAQFMIEKGFVRQLNPLEIRELSAKVGTVRCPGCGAPVDIRRDHACGHCRAPIAILDPTAIEQALARYQHAEIRRTTIDVERLGDALIQQERDRSRHAREKRQRTTENNNIGDMVAAGAGLILELLSSS